MLESIQIKGLFNHKNSVVPIAKGLTVITGLNDSGKSSILHSLRWLVTNHPRGGKLLLETESRAVKEGTITVVNDGISISKTRTDNSKTFYDLEGEIYHKADLPEEIRECLEINPIYKFGDQELELNYAFQLDAPFLISEAPSAGAAVLGQLAGTKPIDQAEEAFDKESNKARLEIHSEEKSIENNTVELAKHKYVEEHLSIVNSLLAQIELLKEKETKLQTLRILLDSYNMSVKTFNKLHACVERYKDVKTAVNTHKRAFKQFNTMSRYNELIGDYAFNLVVEFQNAGIVKSLTAFIKYKQSLPTLYKKIGMLPILQDAKVKHSIATKSITTYQDIITKRQDVITHKKAVKKHIENVNKLQNLMQLYTANSNVETGIVKYSAFLDLTANMPSVKIVKSTQKRITYWDTLTLLLDDYLIVLHNCASSNKSISEQTLKIQALKEEQFNIWKQVDICPLCKTVLGGKHEQV